MERVKSQAAVVSQLLFDSKTAETYKNFVVLTGQIIKEIALLLWLLICSVLVLIAWLGDTAKGAGQRLRQWWQIQQNDAEDGNQAAAATGKAFLDVSQSGANFLLDKAREQLGLEKLERLDSEPKAATSAAPKASVTKSTPATETVAQPAKSSAEKTPKVASDTKTNPEKAASDGSVTETR